MKASKINRKYGWRPDLPDHRDNAFAVSAPIYLPPTVDLSSYMPPVYDQGSLGCHDDRTEVLTNAGWKTWSAYKGVELLATMNPFTHLLEYQAPTALIAKEYKGELYCSNHRSVSFALTPNHRMYQRRWDQKKKMLKDTFDFLEIYKCGWYYGLPHATKGFKGTGLNSIDIDGQVYNGDDFIALCALLVSDGWVGGTETNASTLSFCCFRDDRISKVQALGQRLGLHELPGRKGVWKWSNASLCEWVRRNCYTNLCLQAPFKRVPEIIKLASQSQITLFLDYFGDQTGQSPSRQFSTSSVQLFDDLQELLLKVGKRGSPYIREPRISYIRGRKIESKWPEHVLLERKVDRLSIDSKEHVHREFYDGMVYCATVPNSTLITRRDSTILISGNSCTANAIASAFDKRHFQEQSQFLFPSRLFIYYNEREMEGTIPYDAGARIRDGVKSVAKQGACSEALWDYNPSNFAYKPPPDCYEEALLHRALMYASVPQTLTSLKTALASGHPIVFGFTVYESFESHLVRTTGRVELPKSSESALGGHAVVAVGYDDDSARFKCLNSWGADWGVNGFFTMPYSYLLDQNLSADFWVLKDVS